MNPFDRLYKIQDSGTAAFKQETLQDYPIMVDIEPVGLCNFRCVCCPTGLQAITRKQGMMEDSVYYSLLSQCAAHDMAIRFIGWGEPTLHPRIVSFVQAATDVGVLTHMNTNGSKMTWDLACDLVDAGLSSIKFSFQGVDKESYEETRQVDFFEGMIEAINTVLDARGDGRQPFIAASTSTTHETPQQIEAFKKRLTHLVDYLSIGKTVFDFIDSKAVRLNKDKFERLKALSTTDLKHPDPCPEVWDKLSVAWDGSIRVCCNDANGTTNLGNVVDGIEKAWSHPTMLEYRGRLLDKDYSGPLCSSCYDYAGLSNGS
jgi:organic radical activating enzyme